jgi:hypothetical protein
VLYKPPAASSQVPTTVAIDGELEHLGKHIAAHLLKARAYEAKVHEKAGVELRRADDHWNTVTQLLAEAKAKCGAGGFEAFKRKYCPDLSRSRIYELLAIGSGKTTVAETRARKRERVAKSRAKAESATGSVADSDIGTDDISEDSEASIDDPVTVALTELFRREDGRIDRRLETIYVQR